MGKKDRFINSNFHWPYIVVDKRATTVWRIFILSITNSEGSLLSFINTSIHKSVHIRPNSEILDDKQYLKLIDHNGTLYFELEYIRSRIRMKKSRVCRFQLLPMLICPKIR